MSDLVEAKGDVFWNLPSWITYEPGYDIGCTIYVANTTDTELEYSLISRLYQDSTVISEEAIRVYGLTWFKVDPGDLVTLHGSLRFNDTDCAFTVLLVERETEEVVDSVTTYLAAPTAQTLPPGWSTGVPTTTADWLDMLLPFVMLGMMGAVVVAAVKKPEERKQVEPAAKEEQKLLPPGRYE